MKLQFHLTSGGGDGKVVPPNVLYDFDADDYATTTDLTVGQQLDTSGWIVGSGTWAIRDVSGKKWIEARSSSTNQFVYYPINQNSYGTWLWTVYKSQSAECTIDINDRLGMVLYTPNSNGFWLHFNVNNFLSLNRVLNGTSATLMRTEVNYLSITTQYRICLTRDNNGVSTLYVIGGSFTNWTQVIVISGTNPATYNAVNPTQYLNLRGDRTGTRFSDITHIDQVINPTTTPELIPNI